MKKLLGLLFVSVVSLTVIAGCTSKDSIKNGDLISIAYTATFADGKVFDQNTPQTPLMFTVGSGEVIEGINKAVTKMKVGKTKTFTITPDEGYGKLYNKTQIQKVAKLIFDEASISLENGTLQKIGDIEGIIRGTEQDENGNTLVLFDVNPRETRDTLKYEITILAKDTK